MREIGKTWEAEPVHWSGGAGGVFINVAGLLTWHSDSFVFFAGEEQEKGGYPVLT